MFCFHASGVLAILMIALIGHAPIASAQDGAASRIGMALDTADAEGRYHFSFAGIRHSELGMDVGQGSLEQVHADTYTKHSYPAVAKQLSMFDQGDSTGFSDTPLQLNGTGLGVRKGSVFVSRKIGRSLNLAVTGRWLDMKRMFETEPEEQDDLHLSAFWNVARNTIVQADILSGTRLEDDGTTRASDRIRLALKYDF